MKKDEMNNNDKVKIKEYVDTRLKDMEKILDERQNALLARLANMNEFREQINKERSDYVIKSELKLVLDPINVTIKELKEAFQFNRGRNYMIGIFVTLVLSATALIIALIGG